MKSMKYSKFKAYKRQRRMLGAQFKSSFIFKQKNIVFSEM